MKKKQEYGTTDLVDSVMQTIKNHDIIIMKGHGFVAIGKNMDQTGNLVLRYLEKI